MAGPLRVLLAGGAVTAAVTLTAPLASALSQEEVVWCVNVSSELSRDQQIRACTSVIVSGRWKGEALAWAFTNRGLAYYVKGDLGLAFIDFNESIRLDSKNAVAFNNRGLVRQAQGDLDLAIADYGEAIRLDPTYVFAFNNRGAAFGNKGDYDRAIADYNDAIHLDPEFSVAFGNRGDAYLAKNELDHAISEYDQAIRLDAKYVQAFANRGTAYLVRGDYVRSIADYDEAIRLDPDAYAVQLNRGLAYLYSGAMPKALADVKRSSELNPKYAYAALWLDILNKRSNVPSQLAEVSAQIDMTRWPAALVRLYLGQIAPEAVFAAADDTDANKKKSQICEADFFVAQLELQRRAKEEAARLLRRAESDCSAHLVKANARAELKALGARP